MKNANGSKLVGFEMDSNKKSKFAHGIETPLFSSMLFSIRSEMFSSALLSQYGQTDYSMNMSSSIGHSSRIQMRKWHPLHAAMRFR